MCPRIGQNLFTCSPTRNRTNDFFDSKFYLVGLYFSSQKVRRLADEECTCISSKAAEAALRAARGEGFIGEDGKRVEDEETRLRKIEQRQIRREKRLDEQIRRQEAMTLLRTEIAERVAMGESLTEVLQSVGVSLKDEVIIAATMTQKERKKRTEVAVAKEAMKEKIRQENKEKTEREEAAALAASRGPEYYLPLIGSTLLFIGISTYLYKFFNMTCVIKMKANQISKYITTAFCNEMERRKPKPVYKCKLLDRPHVFVTKKVSQYQ